MILQETSMDVEGSVKHSKMRNINIGKDMLMNTATVATAACYGQFYFARYYSANNK
jgi:hypothetical protein